MLCDRESNKKENVAYFSVLLRCLFKSKIILCFKGRGRPPTEPLPDGWIMTFHNSGIPVYLHRESRVVTWSRPYFLGTGSIRVRTVNYLHTKILKMRRVLVNS